jgi:pentatricopeptide repeat protein
MIAVYASWMVRMCRFDDALEMIDMALKRDPYAYDWFWDVRAGGLAAAGRYGEAIECFGRMRSTSEIPPLMYCFRAICYGELGQFDAARVAVEQCRASGRSPEVVFGEETFVDPAVFERLMTSLRSAVAAAESLNSGGHRTTS